VSKLPPDTTDKDLNEAFSVFGTVLAARVNVDKHSHQCKVSGVCVCICIVV